MGHYENQEYKKYLKGLATEEALLEEAERLKAMLANGDLDNYEYRDMFRSFRERYYDVEGCRYVG